MPSTSTTPTVAGLLAEARLSIHSAVAEHGDRRRMFAHDAATLAADAALHPDAEPSQRATAQCYLDETAGLLARAREEMAAAPNCLPRVTTDPLPTRHGTVAVTV